MVGLYPITAIAVAFFSFLLYLLLGVLYNLFFSPLRRFPGPKLWAISRLPHAVSLCSGNLVHDIQRIHLRYGDIVRIAPNEVSFVRPEALHDIYVTRPGRQTFPKNPNWWDPIPGRGNSIVSLPTGKDHARIRKTFQPSFTEKSLAEQEGILRRYTDLLVAKLREEIQQTTVTSKNGNTAASAAAVVDIAKWYNYTTFDIIGDLAFADPFDCLAQSKYHPWIEVIFQNLKAIAYLISMRLICRPLERMLFKCLPATAMEAMNEHYKFTCDKVQRRLGLEKTRLDIMTHIINQGIGERGEELNDKKGGSSGMSMDEIEGSFNDLIIAGSETSGTSLVAATNSLVNNPDKLAKLVAEIRTSFTSENDFTFARLKDLPYLNAVINETFRMCPPVPSGLSHIVPPGGATVCGHWLPGGTHVATATYTLHRHPSLFHDSDRFIPERWLQSSIENPDSVYKNDARTAVQPFGLGKRQCIGMALAWAQLRLIIAQMMWAFDLERAETKDGIYRWEQLKTWQLLERRPFEVCIKEKAR